MFKNLRRYTVIVVVVVAMLAVALPTMAQNDDSSSSTITVVGTGTAYAVPDTASVELGIENRSGSIRDAFSASNSTIDAIIGQLVELGVDRSDVTTSGLSIYRDYYGTETDGTSYVVSNNIRVTIRDVSMIADVINTAVEGGANQMYGLTFSLSDTTALTSSARADAMTDARARAEELANLAGLSLGSVVRIVEQTNYYGIPMMGRGGGGTESLDQGAVVEPGMSNISLNLEVTFSAR